MDTPLFEQLRHDPLVVRRTMRVSKAEDAGWMMAPPVVTPMDVIGEQRSFALLGAAGRLPIMTWEGPVTDETRFDIGAHINNAVPYLFRTAIHDLALGYNLPKHIVGDELPHDSMWFTFEGALPLIAKRDTPPEFQELVRQHPAVVDAVLVQRLPSAIRFQSILAGDHSVTVVRADVAIGARFPDEVPASVHQWLGLIAFINSPFVESVKQRVIEKGKKRKHHGRRIIETASVNVVRLRSGVQEAVDIERGNHGPQWKGRWLVRGHYRAQWYPSTATHRVIWIAPYLKGPDDAPMVQQLYDVIR